MRAGDREEDASLPSKADPTTDPPRPDEHTASGANASTTTTRDDDDRRRRGQKIGTRAI